jgi:hypothetical protein
MNVPCRGEIHALLFYLNSHPIAGVLEDKLKLEQKVVKENVISILLASYVIGVEGHV